MYNQPFFIPGYSTVPNMMRAPIFPSAANTATKVSLFGRLGNAFKGIKSFNWSGLINNTSKTLGIINQTIPLVRQVGPMVGNMRSMLKLASVFKDETDIHPQKQSTNYTEQKVKEKEPTTNDYINNDSPTFFIN